jgi:hypothetical protein
VSKEQHTFDHRRNKSSLNQFAFLGKENAESAAGVADASEHLRLDNSDLLSG